MNNVVQLLSLTISNFRSFSQEQVVTFDNRANLIQIDGINEDTGGSSGAGKSTIFTALDYLLGISDIPSTVLVPWNTTAKISVTGLFKVGDEKIKITRTNKTGKTLTVETPTETISGSADLAEEKIDQYLKIPRKLFKKMIHKPQKTVGFFLQMTPKQMYEFLIIALNLEEYNNKTILIDKDIKSKKEELEKYKNQLETLIPNLEQIKELLKNKTEPLAPDTSKLKEIEENIQIYQANILANEENYNKEVSQLSEPKPEKADDTELVNKSNELDIIINNIQNKIQQKNQEKEEYKNHLQSTLLDYSNKQNEFNNAKQSIQKIGSEVKKLKSDKESILSSICPTCSQTWNNSSSREKVEQIDKQLELLKKKALDYKKIIDDNSNLQIVTQKIREDLTQVDSKFPISDLEKALSSTQQQKSDIASQIKNIELQSHNNYLQKKSEYDTKVKEIQEKFNISTLKDQLNNLIRERDSARQACEYYRTQVETFEKECAELSSLIVNKERDIQKLQTNIDKLSDKILIAEESKRFVKSFVLDKFSDTLDQIGETATELLSNIPNMKNASIYFEGCKETKSGKVKDEVTGILSKGDALNIPIKAISGGEETAVNLAVDLAVIDVIEKQSGCGADFFVIDEPFDGLDSIGREECLTVLSNFDTNKKIILIDHSEELKQIVNDKIVVIKRDGVSFVE